ncbi:MAG: preprotein translocase subunit SecE [Clostridiales bacterium]|nr:preprotein translocase subunit SecE [Clostridiales bacterium]
MSEDSKETDSIKMEPTEDDPRRKRGKTPSRGDKNASKTIGERFSAFFKEVKGEYNKVIWPSRQELVKQTVTVMLTSIIIGAVIVAYDSLFGFGMGAFADLIAAYGDKIGL